jgi:O-antigen ligase
LFIEEIRTFVDEIVFKGNAKSSRDELFEVGLMLYGQSSFFEQIFGMEYDKFKNWVDVLTGHANLHNSYIQTLLTGGIKGFMFLISIIVSIIVLGIKTLKTKKNERTTTAICIGWVLSSLIFMLTTTGSLFASSIDSYFLTMCAIIVPKYVFNALASDTFNADV